MYDEGKKTVFGNLIYMLLWLGGFLLLGYLVYRIGFASVLGEEDEQAETEETVIVETEENMFPADNETAEPDSSEISEEPLSEEAEPVEETLSEEEMAEFAQAAKINELLGALTTEQKVAQLFFITPEELTGVETVTAFGNTSVSAYQENPVGGLIYFADNLKDPDQVREMIENAKNCSQETVALPLFTGIDEEGGRILRLAGNAAFSLEAVAPMAELASEGADKVTESADYIGQYLRDYGFNVDFAPVADISTGEDMIGDRSFGSDPAVVTALDAAYCEGLKRNNILTCYKHFPGHGSVSEDTHTEAAESPRTLEELRAMEFIPFIDGVTKGTDFIMAGHISLPQIPETEGLPASLSEYMLTEVLRNEFGYDGIIITDSLSMGAITEHFSAAEAALKAFQAGADMLLMPEDFTAAYEEILSKVQSGEISEERLDQSIERIIRAKLKTE
ncbi:MAG: glycoside hydrolase family 3 protein [Lachnospiraceae bacterium]|nr:glycoside hydrolase family 3 protein [Lachnospiraceae bacterium]